MKKTLSLLMLLGAFPSSSFGLASCSSQTSVAGIERTAEISPSGNSMAQMDHGSMSSSMNMDLGPKDQSFDLRFIDAMTPHHEGAVQMSQEALQKSQRPEIKQLAQSIIAAQDQEISQMKAWRQAWYPDASSTPVMYDASTGHLVPMSDEMRSGMMMEGSLGAADQQFDLRFINAMVPHHQGAVTMAQEALAKSDRPEIKRLAQNIIASQQQEIGQMQQWRKAWYGS